MTDSLTERRESGSFATARTSGVLRNSPSGRRKLGYPHRRSVGQTPPLSSSYGGRTWATGGRFGARAATPQPMSSVIMAPSGYSDSGDSGPESMSFLMQAPSGYTDSEDEEVDDGEVQSRAPRRSSLPGGLSPYSLAQRASVLLHSAVRQNLLVTTQKAVGKFEAALLDVDAEEEDEIETAKRDLEDQQAAEEGREAASREAAAEQSSQLLEGLRREHRAKAERVSAVVDAAQRKEAARREAEEKVRAATHAAAEERRWKEDEQRRKAEMDAAAQQEQAKAQEAARQVEEAARQAEEAARQAEEAAKAAASQQAGGAGEKALVPATPRTSRPGAVRAAPGALKEAKELKAKWEAAKAEVKPLLEDANQKKERRALDKFITLNVQQISANKMQIRTKAGNLINHLNNLPGAARTYGYMVLANRLANQCECQVALKHTTAFPIAEVAVTVAREHPDFRDLLLARLQQSCILVVPKYCPAVEGADEGDYLKRMGYQDKAAEGDGTPGAHGPMWESTDEYVSRMQGYVLFYAAMLQSDHFPEGPGLAWTYLARLLNNLPTNRLTATALEAFINVAGFKLSGVFKHQFHKLVAYVHAHVMSDLDKQHDPDAHGVYTRMEMYVENREYMRPPEGRNIPDHDLSSEREYRA